jgi:PAS domain S-box-containing protein
MLKARILIVEDDGIVAEGIKNSLIKFGYSVLGIVSSGEEAIQKSEEHNPDLVLMDIVLKGEMNGIKAATEIRRRFGIPVIYITAYVDDKTLEQAKSSDPFGYLTKPFENILLKSSIEMALYRDKAEKLIKESEEKYRALIETSSDCICNIDPQGTFIYMNPVGLNSHGKVIDEIRGEHCTKLAMPEYSGLLNETLNRANKGETVQLQYESETLLGRRWFESTLTPLKNDLGEVESLLRISRDVTERRRIEEALKESKIWMTNIYNSLDEAVLVVTPDNIIKNANRAAVEMFGYSKDELYGRASEILHVDRKHYEEFIRKREDAFYSQGIASFEFKLKRKNGKIFPTDHSISLLKNDTGSSLGIISVVRDISKRKLLEDQLRHSQKMESVGRLAGGIAHDFSNMLSAILGYSELTLDSIPADSPVRENIKTIYEAGIKAADLTGQLLAFSRKQVLEMKVVKLDHVVKNMAKILHRVIGEDILLELNTRPSSRNVEVDPGQIEHILMNLVVNARDAMPSGGRIIIETGDADLDELYATKHEGIKPGPYVMISVTDTGIGMSREVMEKIFEPFYSTKGVGGTGLGLATAYGIVKQHNGYIYVYSEPSKGTSFKLYFPETGEDEDQSVHKIRPVTIQGTETILVVDDEPSIRKLVKDSLQPLGYLIIEAASGEEALKFCKNVERKIDLLLTDIIMTGMSGKELAELIKKDRPSIIVIFMSGYTDDIIKHYGILDSREIFIQKPLTCKKMANKIREIFDRRNKQST